MEELSHKHNLSPGYLNRQLHTARTSLPREVKKESDGQKSKWKFFETLNYMKEDVVKNAPLLSPGNPLSHVNFSISFSRPFLVFIERKAQTESSKRSLPIKPPCLFTHDVPITRAGFSKFLLRDKLVTHAIIYAQQWVSTCNATMLRDKLKKNVACITGPYRNLLHVSSCEMFTFCDVLHETKNADEISRVRSTI